MDSRFFAGANDIDKQVQNGEISGFIQWPLEGSATVQEIKADYKNGVPYFFIKLLHDSKGIREFALKVPQASDKDAAKFMGMQRIYATLYPIGGSTPGKTSVQDAFAAASKVKPRVTYKLEEYEAFSEKHGKMFTNQSLAAIILEDGDFV